MAKLQADDVEDWAKVKRAEKLAWQNDTEEDYDNALSYDNALDMED